MGCTGGSARYRDDELSVEPPSTAERAKLRVRVAPGEEICAGGEL